MSTTKGFEIPTASKAAAVKRRFHPATEQPKGSSSPSQKDDLITRIGTDKKHDISDGLALTLDVIPDFRWILMAIIYYANVYYSTIDIKNRSKTSPATIVFYFMSVIYAHLLISDLYLRDSPSYWANDFMNDAARREFLEFLLAMPVPEILIKFIETLTATSDPRRPHIKVIPTLAGYSHHHDFGRFFPISIFGHMHNISATLRASSSTETAWNMLFKFQPITNMSVGSLFSQHISPPTGSNTISYGSKFFQSLESLFNPLIERSIQRRNTFASTPMHPMTPAATDIKKFNPYVLALNCDSDNLLETQTILESVISSLLMILPFKGQIGTLYENLSGLDILRHGYSSYALPTWTNGTNTDCSSTVTETVNSHSKHATFIWFLQPFTVANTTDLKYPDPDSTINKLLYLVKKVTKTENFPDPKSDFRLFNGNNDVTPRIRILDPYDINVSSLSSVIYCGLIIESLEIDGSVVPHPDTDATLDDDNSQALQSALPLRIIRRGTSIQRSATMRIDTELRHITVSDSQKAATFKTDLGEHRLGTFDAKVDHAIPAELPFFRIREHTSWFSRMSNVIAFKTKTRDTHSDDTDTHVEYGSVILWSPFRYVTRTWTPLTYSDDTYMISNFRTLYGTNVPLTEIAHPLSLLPIN
jgi:hypothetical protein